MGCVTSKRSERAKVGFGDNSPPTFSRVHMCEDLLDAAKLGDRVHFVRSQRMDELVLVILGHR